MNSAAVTKLNIRWICLRWVATRPSRNMFDRQLAVFTRGLSLFHGWLPFLLVWLLVRLGYDKRALTPGPLWRPAWYSFATFLLRPRVRNWPIQTYPSTSIICTGSTTGSRKPGSTKTFTSSCGLGCCGSSRFSPPTWPCAKSLPRRRQWLAGNSPSDFFNIPTRPPGLGFEMFGRVTPHGINEGSSCIMAMETEYSSEIEKQLTRRIINNETQQKS